MDGLFRSGRPQIFISYSRRDEADALRLAGALTRSRCRVFIDTEGLLIGEQFAARLQAELARSDGLLFLHTAHSGASEWCRAEVYAASVLGLQLLRVKKGDAGPLPDPMERMLSGVHYLAWQREEPPALEDHLKRARRHALRRTLMRGIVSIGAAGVMVLAIVLFFSRWDEWQTAQKRESILSSIASSRAPWSAGEVEASAAGLQRDRLLLARVRGLRDDPTVVDTAARLNAWQLDQQLSHAQERRGRWDLSGVDWRGAALKEALLADVTIRHGRVRDFVAEGCKVAGTYFGSGPGLGADTAGLSFVDASFNGCDFWYVRFDRTQLLSVEFRDSKFRGVDLSVEGFAAVRFVSTPSTGGVITPTLALFENSIIRGLPDAPEPGVLDLTTPDQEVIFDGVEFVRVTFSGWFRPEWFRNSHFVECAFPASLDVGVLNEAGNSVEGTVR